MSRILASLVVVAGLVINFQSSSSAQRPVTTQMRATTITDLRTWDRYITQAERSGELRVRSVARDPSVPSREIERLEQFYSAVRIWGAEVVRDSEQGAPQSIFGQLSPQLDFSVVPTLRVPKILT